MKHQRTCVFEMRVFSHQVIGQTLVTLQPNLSITLCNHAHTQSHLNSRRVSVDLPLPVAPTKATVLLGGTWNDTCSGRVHGMVCL